MFLVIFGCSTLLNTIQAKEYWEEWSYSDENILWLNNVSVNKGGFRFSSFEMLSTLIE